MLHETDVPVKTPTRKEQILDSAEVLARSRGFDAFSYADLEALIGIRKASIHHHFPSKGVLALELVERYRQNFSFSLNEIASNEITAAGRLSSFLDMLEEALDGGKQLCLCIAFSACSSNLSAEVMQEIEDCRAMFLEWLKDVFKLGANDLSIARVQNMTEEANSCQALLEGAQLIARSEQSIDAFRRTTKILRDRLIH